MNVQYTKILSNISAIESRFRKPTVLKPSEVLSILGALVVIAGFGYITLFPPKNL